MAKKIVKAQMMQRRDIALQWSIKNPVLLDGELGIVTDQPGSYKVGDGVTAWNDLPLRGFDGNIVHTPGESATAVMSQKGVTEVTDLLGKRIAESAAELAQLSQEFEEIKNADFTLNPHIEMVEPTETALAIEPDKIYKWGEVASLAITLNPQTNPRYASQYFFQFVSPADAPTSLALPMELKWQTEPTIKAGMTYQVSIVENLAILCGWETIKA